MQQLHTQEVFKTDKLKFFQQQAFDNNMLFKKWAIILLAVIGIYQGVLFQCILPEEIAITTSQTNYICTGLVTISLTSYYTSIFKFSEKITKRIYKIRCILLFISVLSLTIALGLIVHGEMFDRIQHNDVEKWFYSLTLDRNAVWVVQLIDILIPIWYFKILVPGVYWVINIMVYYQFDMKYKGILITCYSFAALFTIVLWGMKAYYEWRIFRDRTNIEAWDDVHKNILDKVPDAIAVIDEQAKVIYSNSAFHDLCKNDLEELSQKLTDCKNSMASTCFESTPRNNDGRSINPQTNETCTVFPFSEILKQNILPIIKKKQNLEKYLTFSAKLTTNSDNELDSRSYEIKFGSLLKYNKVILILSDTTQRDLAVSLETANQYKDKLLATVSHDLRAPINGSMSLLESSIEHQAVPDFIKEQFLVPAQRSCKFLLHLVNDILDFSQINAQKLRMNFESSSLVETIKSCYQLLEMQANKKKIDFRLVVDENLPDIFTTDHNRLAQVIINLLTNAIKFTFSGSVTLSAQVINDLVRIKVVDTGIGIKDQDKAKLFQEFTRIKYEQRNLNTRGVGLGLVIANKLAQVLGPSSDAGGISLSSAYGQGSTFEFLLQDKGIINDDKEDICKENNLSRSKSSFNLSFTPFIFREEDFLFQKMDEGDLSRHGLQYSARIPSSFSLRKPSSHTHLFSTRTSGKKHFKGRVLVVDDNPINILALETIMKQYGIYVDTAYNGKEAIDKVMQNKEYYELVPEDTERMCGTPEKQLLTKDSHYQIIFMDYEMPVMNGLETTKALRELMQDKKINYIPIIGCTGHEDKQTQEEGIVIGMTDVITKPPLKQKLLDILEKYIPWSY